MSLSRWHPALSTVAGLGGTGLAAAVWLGGSVAPAAWRAPLASSVALLVGVGAAIGCALAVRASARTERGPWAWALLASVGWVGGLSYRDAILGGDVMQLPVPLMALWLLAGFSLLAAAIVSLGSKIQATLLAATLLDAAAVVLMMLAVGSLALSLSAPSGASIELVTLMFPGLYAAAAAAAVSSYWTVPDQRLSPALAWLVAAASAGVVAFAPWPQALAAVSHDTGSLVDPMMTAAAAFLGAAGLRWREDASRARLVRPATRAVGHPALPMIVAAIVALCLVGTNIDPLRRADAVVDGIGAIVLLALAARAALELQAHGWLASAAERAVAQFQTLYDAGLATTSATDVEKIARNVVDRATELVACDGAMLAVDEPGRGFVIRALRKYSQELRDPVGEPLVGIALDTLETHDLVVAERYSEHRYSNPKLYDLIASAMAAPLIAEGRLIGTLTVYSRIERRFDAATRRFLRLYAAQAGVAIANALLLEESRRLASNDPLTGLLNRRLLVERLEAEVAQAARHGDAFCVVLCDVDRLKEVNDAAGHLVGDEVLRLAASALRGAARTADVVARFGGDEFVLLLPRTNALQGQALVARITARLRGVTYTWGGRELPLPQLSFGLAAFPHDGLTADALIAAADERMYAEKRGGRRAFEDVSGAE